MSSPAMCVRAWGPPLVRGTIRASLEDFRVDEILGFEADSQGQHALVQVEKSGANTQWVAAQLARAVGAHPRDVGYSGLKDRRAVTRQAYTLPLARGEDPARLLEIHGDGFRVLESGRHSRKLRRGSHRGNRFVIVVRDLTGVMDRLPERLARIGHSGVPNYFGSQRFGLEAANLERAYRWSREGAAPVDRSQRSFALSAARSQLFNLVVAERVRRGDWQRLLEGEAVALDGSASYFTAPVVDETLEARCAAFDVHPSAPMWGAGDSPATRTALSIETSVLRPEAGLRRLLEERGLRHERRATRLAVRNLEWRLDEDVLTLGFDLTRGAFATAVLDEILMDPDVEAGEAPA